MRPRLTYANAMATLALFLVVGGTAYAAVLLNSKNVANSSITGADVKRGSLTSSDLSAAAKAAFTGAPGDAGFQGSTGSTGPTGAAGSQGPRGSAAFMTSAFGFRDTGLVTFRNDALVPNNNGGPGKDWDSPTYSSFDGPFPQLRTAGSYQQLNLGDDFQPMVSLTGMSGTDAKRSDPSLINLTFSDGYLLANATVTLLHRRDGESLASNTSGSLLHGRAVCALFYGTSTDPTQLTQMAGSQAFVSSGAGGLNHELVNVSITGNSPVLASGVQYNVTVKCRDADFTGNTQWQLASGNLTALVSR